MDRRTRSISAWRFKPFVVTVAALVVASSGGVLSAESARADGASQRPVLTWTTFFGSSGPSEVVNDLVVDDDGNVYVVGGVDGAGLPVTEQVGAASGPVSITTRRVSVAADGSQVGRASELPRVSSNGRFVAFASKSPRLFPGDDNKTTDVFLRDRRARTTEIVSVSSTGELGNAPSFPNALSPDGRFVVFTSVASNLAEPDVDPGLEEALDVFIRDRRSGVTERVSVNSDGDAALGPSFGADVSDDGRFVVFESGAGNLSDIDGDQSVDVFVRDRELETTELVSVNSSGEAGNFSSGAPSVSGDGRFVAFDSGADNYVEGDDNLAYDSFVHDRATGTTKIVSVSSTGALGRWGGVAPEIASDSRFVLFSSVSELVPRDTNKVEDAYVHNLQTGRTKRVSVGSSGRQGNDHSSPSGISDDGRYVSFGSSATNLVPKDTNGEWDYFRFDRVAKTTVRVNVNSRGRQARGDKGFLHSSGISGDGRFVVFESSASNLVPNDTNGAYDVFIRGPFDNGSADPPTVGGSEVAEPAIAFTRDDFGVNATDLAGTSISSFGDLKDRYSLDGHVLAGAKDGEGTRRHVVVFDATTKERLSLIRDALSPIAFKGGRRIAFGGDFRRDNSVNSLWVRNRETGRTRKVVQFSTGGSTPGVKTGFRGENAMLETAIDRSGRTAVIVQGNDIDLFIYDAWSVDMRTGHATRLTRGQRSRHASISPNGEQISLLREDVDGFCGGPEPGYRAGDIIVMAPDGTGKRVLVDGDCEVFYDNPRWLDDNTLVARRLTRVVGDEFRGSELVFIDVASGMPTEPFTMTTNVGNFTVSSELGVVAYDDFMNGPGFFVFDREASSTRVSTEGRFPHLKGENIALF